MQVEKASPPSYRGQMCQTVKEGIYRDTSPLTSVDGCYTLWGDKMSEKITRIISLEAVYNNSDLITDYFDGNARLKEWYVEDFNGKKITEAVLRKSLKQLPKWLQEQEWSYQKGEKYSMSDHPYGQLECGLFGEWWKVQKASVTTVNSIGDTVPVRFILTLGYLDLFTMNNKKEPIPTRAEFEALLQSRAKPKPTKEDVTVIPDNNPMPLPVQKLASKPKMSLLPYIS